MAANSIFAAGGGADQKFGGAFRADDVLLDWTGPAGSGANGGTGGGALVQQAQWSCQRTVSMLYEIGSSNVYYVGNRRQGTAQFTRVVGGSASFKNLITTFGNLCKPQNLILDAQMDKCRTEYVSGRKQVKYTLVDATLTQVGASVSAQDIVINEQLGFMFIDLYYE